MSTALSLSTSNDLLFDPASFEHGQRIAKMFASSQLIPPHLRDKVADVTIALMMAKRLGEDPLVVMQSIYIVSGKAGWSAQYMIARANRSGIFKSRIDWRIEGKGEALVVTAFAVLADTGTEVSMSASMKMARDEGWTSNKKYTSMPEVMLRYRSATLLIRMYAGDVMLGYSTVEELETMPEEPVQRGIVVEHAEVVRPRVLEIAAAPEVVVPVVAAAVPVAAPVAAEQPVAPVAAPAAPAAPVSRVAPELAPLFADILAIEEILGAETTASLRAEQRITEPMSGNAVKTLRTYHAALKAEVEE